MKGEKIIEFKIKSLLVNLILVRRLSNLTLNTE